MLRTGGPGAVRRRLLALEQARADYEQWVTSYDTITDADRPLIERQVRELGKRPRVSVVMTTYESSAAWLRLAIESVRRDFSGSIRAVGPQVDVRNLGHLRAVPWLISTLIAVVALATLIHA